MSRVFEALQRSEAERAGTALADMPHVVTDLLRSTEASSSLEQCRCLQPRPAANSRLVSLTNRSTISAEKFRVLGVRLKGLRQTRMLKKVLITSTFPEEGKSVVAANLAVSLAYSNMGKVLLIEGDLRRPAIYQQFGLSHHVGMTEWLKGDLNFEDVLYRLDPPGMWWLPAGTPLDDPLELMQSRRLAELMDQAAAFFDWIIIDSTPLVPLADTSVWARFADGVLLVVREGTTERRLLRKALDVLDRSALIGVVLNGCSHTTHNNYYRYYTAAPAGS